MSCTRLLSIARRQSAAIVSTWYQSGDSVETGEAFVAFAAFA